MTPTRPTDQPSPANPSATVPESQASGRATAADHESVREDGSTGQRIAGRQPPSYRIPTDPPPV